MSKKICAADIRVWLTNNLPCFECSGSDELFFILKPKDIEDVSRKLFELFKQSDLIKHSKKAPKT